MHYIIRKFSCIFIDDVNIFSSFKYQKVHFYTIYIPLLNVIGVLESLYRNVQLHQPVLIKEDMPLLYFFIKMIVIKYTANSFPIFNYISQII